jgi:hypothetical protein
MSNLFQHATTARFFCGAPLGMVLLYAKAVDVTFFLTKEVTKRT